jgi:hypothetical protein
MFRSMLPALMLTLAAHAVHAQATAPNVVTAESSITATVDRIERTTRVLTLRSGNNTFQTLAVDPSVKAFDDLKTGDVVTVRYQESIVVQVRPGATLTDLKDSTAEAQKASSGQVLQQLKAVVKVERIDPQALAIEYRTKDNRKVLRTVADKRVLEGLKVGDQVEVTMTRERAISIERRR